MYILVIHFLVGPAYFLNTRGPRSQFMFHFVNISVGVGRDILCGRQVALALDQDLNCLDSFKNNNNIISNISQTGLSLISSDPS